eukprot:1469177-Prymnesium_polylepis.2
MPHPHMPHPHMPHMRRRVAPGERPMTSHADKIGALDGMGAREFASTAPRRIQWTFAHVTTT